MIKQIQSTNPKPGFRKHYRFRIVGRGPNLLILGGASADWESTLELLSSNFTLIIPSFSKSVLEKQTGSPDPIFYLESLLEELSVNNFSILAHSLSAWIGLRLKALHPHRVSKLILANVPTSIADRSSFDQLHQVLVGRKNEVSTQQASFWFEQVFDQLNSLEELKETLQKTPFLVITGESDRFFSLKRFSSWLDLQDSKLRLEVIRYSGHFSMKDNPWYFSAIVKEFLQSSSYQSIQSKTA